MRRTPACSAPPASKTIVDLDIKVTDGAATVNGCNIVKTDIKASDGVIHVVDCVLIPTARHCHDVRWSA